MRTFEVYLNGAYHTVKAETPEQAVIDAISAEMGSVDYNVTHSFRIREIF